MFVNFPTCARAAAALAVLALPCAATEIMLNGGKLVPIETSVVETSVDNLNFCFATSYPDGSIHLNHSKGIHTVTESQCSDISKDNGRTWTHAAGGACGINSFLNSEGKKVQIGAWALKPAKKHTLKISVFDDAAGKFLPASTCEVELPWSSSFLTHRDVIRITDKRLLATAYGRKEGAKKCHSYMIESLDDGKTWHYLSLIADDPEGKTSEGPDETTIFRLKNGDIVACFRDGVQPGEWLKQVVSKDGGKTWSKPEKIAPFGASPHGRVLDDGTVVLVSGRPNLYMLIDFTGTAKNYNKPVMLYNGSGSSYASVVEVAPNEVVVLHDESDFGSWHSATPFARIISSRFKVVKDDSATIDGGDKRAKDYTVFYSPATRKYPQDLRIAVPGNYQSKGPNALSYYEIVEIAERPYPVLRIISHGDKDKAPGTQWSLFRAQNMPTTVDKLEIGFETRLGDADAKGAQFVVYGVVSAKDKAHGLGYAALALDKVWYYDGANYRSVPCDIGTNKFHTFRISLDGNAGTWTMTRVGDDKPLFTAQLGKSDGVPKVCWGDGSAGVFGSNDLGFIGWKY